VLVLLLVIAVLVVVLGLVFLSTKLEGGQRYVTLAVVGGMAVAALWVAGTSGYAKNRVYFTKGTIVAISENRDSVCISRPRYRNWVLRIFSSAETTECYLPTAQTDVDTSKVGDRTLAGWSFYETPGAFGQGVLLYLEEGGEAPGA
jgi:hypothetical protein